MDVRPTGRRCSSGRHFRSICLLLLPWGRRSGSGESWFDPRRGNSQRDAQIVRVALRAFLGLASVLQAFLPVAPPGISPHHVLLTFLSRSFTGVLITSSMPSVVAS